MIVGIDFDNTIVSYDALFYREARKLQLIDDSVPENKRSIRDHIKRRFDDIAWQKLQGNVYGPQMRDATLIEGVNDFFRLCNEHRIKTYIVSHKTRFANFDDTLTNLREASLWWLGRQDFFNDSAFGIGEYDVFFESTRKEKVERISTLGCTHFIDDLEEVFMHESFDPGIRKIMFFPFNSSARLNIGADDITVCRTWHEIIEILFPA